MITRSINLVLGGVHALMNIGYVDQHYSGLNPESTAIELLQELMPRWSHAESRNHLNTFLLRKNEEVNLKVKYLSGGEKVRLNLETKEHLIQVLRDYLGSTILICHDQNFVNSLAIDSYYAIENKHLHRK